MSRQCQSFTLSSLALDLDVAHGPVTEDSDGPFFYMVQPGRVLLEVALDDTYDFLATALVPFGTLAIAIVAPGWAAPADHISIGVRPSQHPQRFRLRTTMVVGRGGEAAVMRNATDETATVVPGRMEGDIAVALRRCWSARARRRRR
jgi:hypothetical protein